MPNLIDRLAYWWLDRRQEEAAKACRRETGVELRKASINQDGWEMLVVAPDLMFLVDQATGLLEANNAENYIQFEMLPSVRHTQGRAVRVTIQWLNGESPATQNARLRKEIAELEAQVRDREQRMEAYETAVADVLDGMQEELLSGTQYKNPMFAVAARIALRKIAIDRGKVTANE